MKRDVFVASGTCMEPAIHDMEPFLIVPITARPRNNDVVLIRKKIRKKRVYLVHRIHFRTRLGSRIYFVHKGDSSSKWGFALERQITHKALLNRTPKIRGIGTLLIAFFILQVAQVAHLAIGDCEELMKGMRKGYKFLTG